MAPGIQNRIRESPAAMGAAAMAGDQTHAQQTPVTPDGHDIDVRSSYHDWPRYQLAST